MQEEVGRRWNRGWLKCTGVLRTNARARALLCMFVWKGTGWCGMFSVMFAIGWEAVMLVAVLMVVMVAHFFYCAS